MSLDLTLFSGNFTGLTVRDQSVSEIMKLNAVTSGYGHQLTPKQAEKLVAVRTEALLSTGRVEFGGGVIGKIIYAFCDSPYISSSEYEQTLERLIEIFYFYKNETLNRISDDDLIKFMKQSFDGSCHGSLELLEGRELAGVARKLRFGEDRYESVETEEVSEDETEG